MYNEVNEQMYCFPEALGEQSGYYSDWWARSMLFIYCFQSFITALFIVLWNNVFYNKPVVTVPYFMTNFKHFCHLCTPPIGPRQGKQDWSHKPAGGGTIFRNHRAATIVSGQRSGCLNWPMFRMHTYHENIGGATAADAAARSTHSEIRSAVQKVWSPSQRAVVYCN